MLGLTCSLFITYHRFVTVIDMYIDSLQTLVYYIGLIVWSWFIPPCCIAYMLGTVA